MRTFWEKPSEPRVQVGLATGCLWNTAVMVARAAALVSLGARALPEMSARLDRVSAFADSDELAQGKSRRLKITALSNPR